MLGSSRQPTTWNVFSLGLQVHFIYLLLPRCRNHDSLSEEAPKIRFPRGLGRLRGTSKKFLIAIYRDSIRCSFSYINGSTSRTINSTCSCCWNGVNTVTRPDNWQCWENLAPGSGTGKTLLIPDSKWFTLLSEVNVLSSASSWSADDYYGSRD